MWTTLFITVAVVLGCFVVAVYVIRRDWKAYCRLKEARRRRFQAMGAAPPLIKDGPGDGG
jgi:hypothetical protein